MAKTRKRLPRLSRMSGRQREVYEKALHAISLSRHRKLSIRAAAREAHTTSAAVRRYARSALMRRRGEWIVKRRDRLERQMLFYDHKGSYTVSARSSTTASRIGEYHNAIRRFLETGDSSRLRAYDGRFIIDARGHRHSFLADPKAIRQLARAGSFQFESIY